MYLLYVNEDRREIKVSSPEDMRDYSPEEEEFYSEVSRYCLNHFICSKREPLVKMGEELRQRWISQLEKELKKIKEIEI